MLDEMTAHDARMDELEAEVETATGTAYAAADAANAAAAAANTAADTANTAAANADAKAAAANTAAGAANTAAANADAKAAAANTAAGTANTAAANADAKAAAANTAAGAANTAATNADAKAAAANTAAGAANTAAANADAVINSLIDEDTGKISMTYIPGMLVHRWGVQVPASSLAACTRLYEAEGMVANAHLGSYNGALVNDFNDVFLMKGREKRINYDIVNKVILAEEGDADFAIDGTNGDVFVRQLAHWRKRERLSDGSEIRAFADGALEGYEYVPERLIPCFLASAADSGSAANDGNGTMKSIAGAFTIPLTEVSLQNFLTKAQNTGCILMDAKTWADQADMMLIEFASRDMQTKIGKGISEHSYAGYAIQNTGTGINYVIVTNAEAANFTSYSTVTINTTSAGGHDIAWCRKITAITDMGDGTSKIEFDGAAVTVAAGYYVRASKNFMGQSESILLGSGYIGTNGKAAVRYRGVEDVYGHVFQGLLGVLKLGTHPPVYYAADDPANYAMAVGSGYREIGRCLIDTEGYVKTVLFNDTAQRETSIICDDIGAGSTTYWCDYCWRNSQPATEEPTRLRVPFAGGGWNGGTYCGPWSVIWSYAPSNANWHCGARLLVIPPWGERGA